LKLSRLRNVKGIPVCADQRQPSSQNAASGKTFVKVSISKKTAYENEKLVYKFNFYLNVDLTPNSEYYRSDFSSFWNDGDRNPKMF
jgi:hypothetical protein